MEERRDVCWWCGGRLVWVGDQTGDDVFGTGSGLVTFLKCSRCGADVEYREEDADSGEAI